MALLLLPWAAAGAGALLGGLLALLSSRLLLEYFRRWKAMKPIPGISPCYPLLGNAMMFEREGEAFFQQLMKYSEEFRNIPLLKLWDKASI